MRSAIIRMRIAADNYLIVLPYTWHSIFNIIFIGNGSNNFNNNGVSKMTHKLSTPDQWLDLHGDILYRYAFVRVRVPEIAEDLVQETLLGALKANAGYAGEASERTWLIGILKHKISAIFEKPPGKRRRDLRINFQRMLTTIILTGKAVGKSIYLPGPNRMSRWSRSNSSTFCSTASTGCRPKWLNCLCCVNWMAWRARIFAK
ncbi:sigma factor [Methylobacter sp.]|uniref:sigma factor n=1 Tax=Methylobacter sp. TaxID=2051955 RepID=UPI00258C7104|nr:sigma factor [Methylobacter sp.]